MEGMLEGQILMNSDQNVSLLHLFAMHSVNKVLITHRASLHKEEFTHSSVLKVRVNLLIARTLYIASSSSASPPAAHFYN